MLSSWVTALQRPQQTVHHADIGLGEEPSVLQRHINLHNERRKSQTTAALVGILPKLKRAFESATSLQRGSFPVATPEETAFEAYDGSFADTDDEEEKSLSSYSIAESSCGSYLSYNMSRVDEEDDEMDESVMSATDASETDSIFSDAFREMVTFGSCNEDQKIRDNIRLLSTDIPLTSNGRCDEPVSISNTFLRRVSLLSHIKRKPHLQSVKSREEEEIYFGDYAFCEKNGSEQVSGGQKKERKNGSRSRSIVKRIKGRSDGNIFGSNNKKLLAHENDKDTNKRKHRKRKKGKLAASTTKSDPLRELSICHEQMEICQTRVTPNEATNLLRHGMRLQPPTTGIQGHAHHYNNTRGSAGMMSPRSQLWYSADDNNVNDENRHCDAEFAVPSLTTDEPSNTKKLQQEKASRINQVNKVISKGKSHIELKTSSKHVAKFKFSSPKKDTPRVFWGEDKVVTDEKEEPRVLYTDEGEVHAIIHPRPLAPESEKKKELSLSNNVLDHVFHSDLSTLYEESSLEYSSSGNLSVCAFSISNNSATAYPLKNCSSNSILESASSSFSLDDRTNERVLSDLGSEEKTRVENKHSMASAATRSGQSRSSSIDDCDMTMRREFSLGVTNQSENPGRWRQKNMPFMNGEELSNNYVAEI